MKLLLISDKESEYLWDYYQPGRLDGVDLILSCGDLHAQYLSFLVTMGGMPLLYVHGNHDKTYDRRPPEGCECIEDKLVVRKGLRILGLGGATCTAAAPTSTPSSRWPGASGGCGSSSAGREGWTSS